MDPRIVALLQQIQQSQGGAPAEGGMPMGGDPAMGGGDPMAGGGEGGPDENQNGIPDGFEQFAGNPFEGALDGFDQSQAGGDEGPIGGGPVGRPQMGGAMEGAEGELPPNQLRQGENPDSSGPLLSATQQLQKYITNSSDESEIAIARSIIALLARLIERDQAAQSENLPIDRDMMEAQGGAGAAPAAPAGPPAPGGGA